MRNSYTTRLLDDLAADPTLRGLGALAVILLTISAIGLTAIWRTRPAAAVATPLPVIIVGTSTPRSQPTATPAAPDVRELPSGAIVAWDSQQQRWYVVKDAPAGLDQPAAAGVAPTPEPEVYQASANAPQAAPAPESEPIAPAPPEQPASGGGGGGKAPAIDFGQAAPAPGGETDAERWCAVATIKCGATTTP